MGDPHTVIYPDRHSRLGQRAKAALAFARRGSVCDDPYIDDQVTLTGSMNWTGGAAQNSENLNLVASKIIAAAYAGHWNQRLALSSPYAQREDWCRRPEVADFKSE